MNAQGVVSILVSLGLLTSAARTNAQASASRPLQIDIAQQRASEYRSLASDFFARERRFSALGDQSLIQASRAAGTAVLAEEAASSKGVARALQLLRVAVGTVHDSSALAILEFERAKIAEFWAGDPAEAVRIYTSLSTRKGLSALDSATLEYSRLRAIGASDPTAYQRILDIATSVHSNLQARILKATAACDLGDLYLTQASSEGGIEKLGRAEGLFRLALAAAKDSLVFLKVCALAGLARVQQIEHRTGAALDAATSAWMLASHEFLSLSPWRAALVGYSEADPWLVLPPPRLIAELPAVYALSLLDAGRPTGAAVLEAHASLEDQRPGPSWIEPVEINSWIMIHNPVVNDSRRRTPHLILNGAGNRFVVVLQIPTAVGAIRTVHQDVTVRVGEVKGQLDDLLCNILSRESRPSDLDCSPGFPTDTEALSNSLYARLFPGQIGDLLLGSSPSALVVVAPGWFSNVPFGYLRQKPSVPRLGERFPIMLEYAPQVLEKGTGRRSHSESHKALVLLNSLPSWPDVIGFSRDSIPGVSPELHSHASRVVRLLNADSLFGQNASEQEFRAIVGNYSIVHIVAHGRYVPNQPGESFIAFQRDSNPRDSTEGALTAWEISELHLEGSVVTLAACETAHTQMENGNPLSITSAFLDAGASAVIGTRWKVAEGTTVTFMDAFYSEYANPARSAGPSVENPYWRGINEVRSANTQSVDWAGFVLVVAAPYP